MISIKAAKNNFFDRKVVMDAVDRATLRVLSRFGAFVRTRARSSIRKRKRPSTPGQPPSSHVGTLKALIFFSYDPDRKSVVIGPTLSSNPSGAPETLEYGGEADIESFDRARKVRTRHRAKVAARPFMGPAFEAEKPGLPAMWTDSVR